MTQIRVLELVGPVCVDPEDGILLCQQSYAALSQEPVVLLDFTGVRTLTSSFLNSAIGCLFASFPSEELKDRLTWTGLDSTDENLMRLVLKRATQFYSASPDQREAMAAASNRAIED
jgi:hypothetical protein